MREQASLSDNLFKASLGSKGFTFASGFFIFLSLVFIVFLLYAVVAFARLADFSNYNSYFGLLVIVAVMAFSLVMFIASWSLTFETQEITVTGDEIVIRKKRPFLPDTVKKVNMKQVADFTLEKLGFNFTNVWYAFLFHNTTHEDEVDNFFTPHIRLSDRRISFFESADETGKKDIVMRLKKAANLAV